MNNISNAKKLTVLASMLALTACSLTPELKTKSIQEQIDTAALQINTSDKKDITSVSFEKLEYESFFKNDELKQLIKEALDNNKDLYTTIQNVNIAAEKLNIAHANRLPTIVLGVDGNSMFKNGFDNSKGINAGLKINAFELDFFSKASNKDKAARNAFLSQTYNLLHVKRKLVAKVAQAYYANVQVNATLEILRAIKASYADNLRIIQNKYKAGTATNLDVEQAKTQLASVELQTAQMKKSLLDAQETLSLLVNKHVKIKNRKIKDEIQAINYALLPASVISSRYDVQATLANVVSKNIEIGVAKADLLPKIALTTNAGFASDALNSLLDSGVASIALGLTAPIINNREIKSNIKVAEINKDIAVAEYEKTVISAFLSIKKAVDVVKIIKEQELPAAKVQSEAAANAIEIARNRLLAGVDDYIEHHIANTDFLKASINELDARFNIINAEIALFEVF